MREILFRGKCIELCYYQGQWLEGFYGEDDGKSLISLPTVVGMVWYACDSDTIGQYTGLNDKNGTKIFEGDILGYSEQSEHFRYLNNVCFAVFYDNLNACFAVERYVNGDYECKKRLAAFNPSKHLEVIGNIYDNPELLEVEENGESRLLRRRNYGVES